MPIVRRRALTGLAAAALAPPLPAYAGPKVGQPAPPFVATTFGGKEVSLASLRGDVILLNFWATWCGPCRNELPTLEGYFRQASKYGLQMLAVATEDSVSEAQLRPLAAHMTIPFIKRLKGPYHQMEGVPTNYVIDRSGKLVYAEANAFTFDTLNALLIPLLREPLPDDAGSAKPSDGEASQAAPTKPT